MKIDKSKPPSTKSHDWQIGVHQMRGGVGVALVCGVAGRNLQSRCLSLGRALYMVKNDLVDSESISDKMRQLKVDNMVTRPVIQFTGNTWYT